MSSDAVQQLITHYSLIGPASKVSLTVLMLCYLFVETFDLVFFQFCV